MSLGREYYIESLIENIIYENNQEYLFNNKLWQMSNGKKIKIQDMTQNHLINTINYLKRNKDYTMANDFIKLMMDEINKRNQGEICCMKD